MGTLFNEILKMSVSAVPVILIVLCLRFAARKFPKSYSFALWMVVFACLVIPFKVTLKGMPDVNYIIRQNAVEFAESFKETRQPQMMQKDENSAQTSVQYSVQNTQQDRQEQTQVTDKPGNIINNPGETVAENSEQAMLSAPRSTFTLQMWHIWLCGILVLFAFEIVNLKGIYDKIKFAFKKQDNIYYCDETNIPFVYGILKPRIILPSDISPVTEQFVIRHEQNHIDRKDYIIKPLCFLITIFHWFNPLVWLSFALMVKDMELSCDEKAVKNLNAKNKQEYCEALLNFAVKNQPYKINAVLFGEGNCSMRIKNILNFKQPKKLTAVLLSLCVLLTGCTAFATGEGESTQNSGNNDGLLTDSYNETYADKEQENSEEVFNYQDLWVKENDPVDIMWFSDAAFVGDSITEGLKIYTTVANSIGDIASFITASNLSPSKIVNGIIDDFNNLEPLNGMEAIAAANPEKIYFSMGTNALVEMSEKDFLAEYVEMLKMAKGKFPDAQIYVTSVPPVAKEFAESRNLPIFRPENLEYVNGQLAQIAKDNGAYYLNLHEVLAGEDGYLKEEYAYTDGMHMKPDAYTEWIEYLMTHTADDNVTEENADYSVKENSDGEYYEYQFNKDGESEDSDELKEKDSEYQQFLQDIDSSYRYYKYDLNEQYYTAQSGDSPISIAKAHELNVEELYAMNPEMEQNGVFVGDKVCVTQINFNWPTGEGVRISRGFTGQYPSHDGIDIAGPYGTEIFASADGKVIKAEESTVGDGNHVVIEHANGYYTLYGHCSELLVKVGDEVKQGDLIAKMGSTGNSTGNHLHFEIILGGENGEYDGVRIDPYTKL